MNYQLLLIFQIGQWDEIAYSKKNVLQFLSLKLEESFAYEHRCPIFTSFKHHVVMKFMKKIRNKGSPALRNNIKIELRHENIILTQQKWKINLIFQSAHLKFISSRKRKFSKSPCYEVHHLEWHFGKLISVVIQSNISLQQIVCLLRVNILTQLVIMNEWQNSTRFLRLKEYHIKKMSQLHKIQTLKCCTLLTVMLDWDKDDEFILFFRKIYQKMSSLSNAVFTVMKNWGIFWIIDLLTSIKNIILDSAKASHAKTLI